MQNENEKNNAFNFKIGDLVVHTSAPALIMTIYRKQGDRLWCRWLDKKNQVQTHAFTQAELMSYQTPKIDE